MENGSLRTMVDRLKKANHFASGLSDGQLQKLAALGQETGFPEDDLMLAEGQRSESFYLLLSGSACVEVSSGCCTVCVQALAPGDAFGWSSFLSDHDTLFQVRARERCAALRLDSAALATVCREDPELGVALLRRVLETVAQRISGLELRLAEFCGFSRESLFRQREEKSLRRSVG